MLGMLGNLLGGNVIGGVNKVVKTVFGDKSARDKAAADVATAGQAQYAAEFQVQNRTWFDSLVDGFNRMMRPTMWYSTLLYMWLSFTDIDQFIEVTNGLRLVPEPVFVILGVMVGFLFPIRELKPAFTKAISNFKKDGKALVQDMKTERDISRKNSSIEEFKKIQRTKSK
jgi:hypothetical protein